MKCIKKNKNCKLISNYKDKNKSFMCAGLCKPTDKKYDVIKFCLSNNCYGGKDISMEIAPDEALNAIQVLSFAIESFLIDNKAYRKFREEFK